MEEKGYEVPLLPHDQSRISTSTQCAYLLHHLETVMDEIFGTILNQINDKLSKIENLNHRLDSASGKVEQLKGRTNATQVFSSPIYPGKGNPVSFQRSRPDSSSQTSFEMLIKEKTNYFEPPQYDSSLIKEKLDFFHVHDRRSQQTHSKESSWKEGLGRLPPHLSSVSSLLLYNTTHNPYKKYMLLDPLGVVSGTRGETKIDDSDNVNLPEAPVSIKEGDQPVKIPKDEFQYLPDLSDLPELNLPLELPSLPGIANDLSYEADEEGPSIAPSLGLPDLPLFDSVASPSFLGESRPPPPPPVPIHDFPTQSPSDQPRETPQFSQSPSSISQPPPPPPPLPSSREVPPPPPPPPFLPPPPPLPPSLLEAPQMATSDTRSGPASSPSSSRADLMKAIQEAGGVGKAKLRKVDHKNPGQSNEKPMKVSSAPVARDLMSDLVAKLSQRRKGISGTTPAQTKMESGENGLSKKDLSAHSTMQKMSSIIPPPPIAHPGSDSDNKQSDSDWE